MKIDKKLIKELTDYLNEFKLTELEYGDKDTKIKVSKSSNITRSGTAPETKIISASNLKEPSTTSGTKVTSPIIGTAYLAPEPGAKKFSEIGKKVKKGDTIVIIEAMKTMNHVPSPLDGIIKEICVEDGSPIEFGQTIIILE